jgi:hypothetical protein
MADVHGGLGPFLGVFLQALMAPACARPPEKGAVAAKLAA